MFGTACGTQLTETSNYCHHCGQGIHARPSPLLEIENELRFVLPVGTPFSAVIAGYLGLVSVLLLPAPFALIFGIIGLHRIRAKPGLHGAGRCWTGIVLGTIFTVIGLLLIFGVI